MIYANYFVFSYVVAPLSLFYYIYIRIYIRIYDLINKSDHNIYICIWPISRTIKHHIQNYCESTVSDQAGWQADGRTHRIVPIVCSADD